MRKKMLLAIVAVLFLAQSGWANDQLVQELKSLGQAVDNMSMHISKAASDDEATLMAQATQQAFATNLQGNPKPQVSITASAGRCDVVISCPLWRLWSRAENGVIVDHGAKIN
jgi:hypothetical protein